ncbi:hypothetical protein P389DRAFT_164912 [Cystobasidium minutum MCA 4210]|uniref:uncharacterized protein n=1 Tax=Cystobasidium minutum MCA 4210 TaxID=1397322 RepID=UPI0034CDC6AE|eukprot:jgi/Rhomi1/164912/fgenesh1_kg.1_\
MSLGTGSDNGANPPFDINPLRSHAGGPLAVLYSVEPDEDPLLVNGSNSVTRSPSKLGGGSLHSSPFNDAPPLDAAHHPGTPRSVSALAALDRPGPALAASPNRSLLSAFQAVSPRLQNITARSSSAPSLSHLSNGSSARTTSPRGPAPQQPSSGLLAPASPISTSPRQSTHTRTSYATAAFRALNGATSPQKQIPSRSSSGGSSAAASLNVSPVRSRSSSALRQVQNDAPTWQVYRDADTPAESTSTSQPNPPAGRPSSQRNEDTEEDVFDIEEDSDNDENYANENDENSAPAVQTENPATSHARALSNTSLDLAAGSSRRTSSHGLHTHRRSSLSMSSLPRELVARERDVTPPPSASRLLGATGHTETDEEHQHDMPATTVSGSATRARKRLRTSGDLSC